MSLAEIENAISLVVIGWLVLMGVLLVVILLAVTWWLFR